MFGLLLNAPLANADTGSGITYLVQTALLREKTLETQVRSGQVLVPLRQVAEALGYLIDWQWDSRKISLKKEGHIVEIDFAGKSPTLNGKTFLREDAPVLLVYTAYAPLGFFRDVLPEEVRSRGTDEVVIAPHLLKREASYGQLMPKIDADAMLRDIVQLAETPRPRATESEYKAGQFIAERFATMGYQVQKQPFTIEDTPDNTTDIKTSYNVIAVKQAELPASTGEILLLTAHYDSLKNSPGANDNGSGVAVLLEMARLFANIPGDTEIRFIATGSEENGLNGSKNYLATLTEEERSRIIGNINFDTLASMNASPLFINTLNGQVNWVSYLLNRTSENIFGQRMVVKFEGLSDFITFANAGIPAAMICHIAVVGELHTPNDTPTIISKASLTRVASLAAETIHQIIASETESFKELRSYFDNLIKNSF